MAIPQVILDTDFSTDVGDAHALVMAISMHLSGLINLIGVIVSSSNQKAPGAVDAFLRAFSITTIPIGALQGAAESRDPSGPGPWVPYVYDNYTHVLGLSPSVATDLAIYQQVLSAAEDASVSIVAVGGATSFEALRAASPSLVSSKVKELVWTVGDFPSSASEFNITIDVAAATTAMASWPTPIVYTAYTQALTVNAGQNVNYVFPGASPSDILARATLEDTNSVEFQGRPAWDELPLIWTLARESAFTLTKGANAVTTGDGNTFTSAVNGKDAYAVFGWPDCQYTSLINPFLVASRSTGIVNFDKANKYVTFSV